MDQLRLKLGPTEVTIPQSSPNGITIPEELRCKRSDGKQWRCSALSMPDKTVCEKHYVQAKKRAANSALRASLKKAKRTAEIETDGVYLERKRARVDGFAGFREAGRPVRPVIDREYEKDVEGYNGNLREERAIAGNGVVSPVVNHSLESYGTCHQCGKNSRVSWCASCEKRGYCTNCISKWYDEIPINQIRKVCPACRGICNCQVCLQGDNLIKAKVHEMNGMEKLKYLHRLLVFVLPVVKQIYSDQCFEIGVEARAHGSKVEIPRAKINPDQQMLCDFCETPIFDYHRHCLNCSYDLCLSCCTEIRQSSKNEKQNNDNSSVKFSDWKAGTVGTVPCRPHASGGCGASELVLRRLLKINWISKLVKNTEEMVNGCKVPKLLDASSSEQDNYKGLYCPLLEELRRDGISRFSENWELGIPVLVKRAFEIPLSESWDPVVILRGVEESVDGEMDESVIVKAVDCGNKSEVEIELNKFIKGYSDTQPQQGTPSVLEWPSPAVLEEFLTSQRPEFLVNFPLIEFAHSKWGLLNLPSKLPHDGSLTELEPKLIISYGNGLDDEGNELNSEGVNLHVSMCDVVYMLMHMNERKGKNENEESLEKCNGFEIGSNSSELERESKIGAIWDIFRREDMPKLNEFLRSRQNNSDKYPVYDGSIFLNEEAKHILKNEYDIEPWTIKQNVSDAIFIPAGCPFQFTNLQSSVQLKFEFLFPESISESVRMAQEIRCLPNGHFAKLNIMEVRKMCLYAASSAIREIQKISLDPKLKLENKFEDHNLTEAVSENLARVSNKHTPDN
ncbi:hypothetical protein LUZ60_013963 [Juncus effusus]|nr:hypothetical protein LUZ60_013963 [Juncus effusus]